MTGRRGILGLVAGAMAALVLAPEAPAAAPARRWPMRRDGADLLVETAHYRVRTDLGEEVGQAVATQQEVLFTELYRRMGAGKPRVPFERLRVLVYERYERYVAELGGAVAGSRGVFVPAKDVLACWARADQLDVILQTLRHEGTHQFVLHFIGPDCPIWLNEGLAVFHEEAEFDRGRLTVGQVPPGRLNVVKRAMAEGRLIPLAEMLAMTGPQWLANVQAGGPRGPLQYGQAWAMVHFLAYADDKRYQRAFLQYIYYLSRNEGPERAWQRTFGPNTRAFQDRWEEYVRGLRASAGLDCRLNLRLLGWLLLQARGREDLVKDMATFRQAVLDGKFGAWRVQTSDGYALESGDREKVAALFKCSEDKRKDADTSYILVPGAEGEPPVLRCQHHGMTVLETRYVKDEKGQCAEVTVVARPAAPGRR
jgi:hypothetical protein